MQSDRREILRKLQQQRQSQRAVSNHDEPTFEPTASLVSLRQFNASDFNDADDDDYDDDNVDVHRASDGDRTDLLKLILYDLNSAIAPRDLRLLAIRSALDEFDHDNEQWHDEELELRADHILLQKLTYALSVDPQHEEVGYICAALEMVYRAGKTRLAKSFHEICEVILPIFVEMIKRPPSSEKKVEEETTEEEKDEVLLTKEEEEGIEPNENFDPYAPNAYMQQDDEDESAESVTIPAGTGEYFDHMKKMASMGNSQENSVFDQDKALASPALNVGHAEVEVQYRYQPQRQRHYDMAPVGNNSETGGINPGHALVSQPLNLENAGVSEKHSYQPQQQNMSSMGNNQSTALFNQGNAIVSRAVNEDNPGSDAQYSYQPQQQQSIAPWGSSQSAAAFNQGEALVSQPANLGNSGTRPQYSYHSQQQHNMALLGNNQSAVAFNRDHAVVSQPANLVNSRKREQYTHQPEQQSMSSMAINQSAAVLNQGNALVSQSANFENAQVGGQYLYPQQQQQSMVYMGHNQSSGVLHQGNALVSQAVDVPQLHNTALMGSKHSLSVYDHGNTIVRTPVNVGQTAVGETQRHDQPQGQQQYTPKQLYALAEQISKMQEAQQTSRQQTQFMGDQSSEQQSRYLASVSTLQQTGKMVLHSTAVIAPYGQHLPDSTQLEHGHTGPSYESTAFMPQQPPEEIASSAQHLASLIVHDSHLTDEEALRLRGGGDGDSIDDQADNGSYNDENPGTDQYPEEAPGQFDQLFEGGKQFPSAAFYDEYADATDTANPFLDISECTTDSEIDSSIKQQDQVKTRSRVEEDETYNGQVPVNDAGFSNDERGEEFIHDYATYEYAHYDSGEKRYDGQVEVDQDVRTSNTFDPEYAENIVTEELHNDKPMYDAQGNFLSDYSEHIDNEAMLNDQPPAEHTADSEYNVEEKSYDGQVEVDRYVRTGGTFNIECSDNVANEERADAQPLYDAQGNFALDYSDYLDNEARRNERPNVEHSSNHEYNPGEQRDNDLVEVDHNVRAGNNCDSDYAENVDNEEIRNDQRMYRAQGMDDSGYSEYLGNQANQHDQPTSERPGDYDYLNNDGKRYEQQFAEYSGDNKLENNSNPFVHGDFDNDDAADNPFVDLSGRDEQQNINTPSHGEQAGMNASENGHGDIREVEDCVKEDKFGDRNIPTTIGDGSIPTHVTRNLSTSLRSNLSNSQGGDDLSFYIGEIDGTPVLQDHSKNDYGSNFFSDYGADYNPLKRGFENNAETSSRNERNVLGNGTRGQTSYNRFYDGKGFGEGGQNQAPRSEGWSEGSESGGSVYTFPTFKPEEENIRKDSEFTGNHWGGDQSRVQEFSEGGQSSTLHMVEEEDIAQADDHDQESSYNDDIFQFQEPSMAKPMASENFFSSHDASQGFVCPLAVRNVLKILRYFSRVLSAMEQLAQQPGLVDALLYQMTRNPHSNQDEEEISARVDAIACVVNLACAEENKIMLVYHPGLLDAVINIANHDPIEEAREHATIVMMNLAYAEENKVHMVNQDNLLDTLVHLLADVSPFTRRYASAALFTLACTYANTAVMARHCDGGILEALRKVLLNDPVDEARVNAAEALFNMARNNSDDTVENMGNHPKLLASLAHSVLTDYSADVRAYSARALEWLSADIHYPMKCHPRLLQSLTTASQWTKTTCIAEALKMQASIDGNRKSMVEHPGLLDALAQLSLLDGINDDEVKTCAISALERLSKEPSTRHLMVRNEGVMTALTRATFAGDGYDDDDEEEEAPTALLMKTALKNLAEHL